jgi:hypothetical protein
MMAEVSCPQGWILFLSLTLKPRSARVVTYFDEASASASSLVEVMVRLVQTIAGMDGNSCDVASTLRTVRYLHSGLGVVLGCR